MGIGTKLKVLLKNEGLSQRQFAEKIGENVTQLNKVLNGDRSPSFEMLEKTLAHFKDVDLNWLLKDEYKTDGPIPLVSENKAAYSPDVINDILKIEELILNLKSKVSQ